MKQFKWYHWLNPCFYYILVTAFIRNFFWGDQVTYDHFMRKIPLPEDIETLEPRERAVTKIIYGRRKLLTKEERDEVERMASDSPEGREVLEQIIHPKKMLIAVEEWNEQKKNCPIDEMWADVDAYIQSRKK